MAWKKLETAVAPIESTSHPFHSGFICEWKSLGRLFAIVPDGFRLLSVGEPRANQKTQLAAR